MTFSYIKQRLSKQKELSRWRERNCVQAQTAREIKVDGKTYLNFSSNDYLGLQNNTEIKSAMQEGIDRFGICASASSLVTGYHYAHQSLEESICEWLNTERCLLFSSGFGANQAAMHALGQKEANLILDKLSHASLIDGALASKATTKRFKHNDIEHLSRILANTDEQSQNLIVTEGVFSMDGDVAPIGQLAQIAEKHNALTYIDDAHSIGVIGNQGEGSKALGAVDIVMATFGKALATNGAFIACNELLFDYFVNFARHYIYSTAMSPALAWATKQSITIARKEQWRRDKIKELSHVLSTTLDPLINVIPSDSSIHGIVIGSEIKTLAISEKLKLKGFWVSAIRPPTVPNNSSRLRVTITASHNNNDIRHLAKSINEVYFS